MSQEEYITPDCEKAISPQPDKHASYKNGLMLVSHNSKLALYTLDGRKIDGVRSINVSAACDEITVATVEITVVSRDAGAVINRFSSEELVEVSRNFSLK